MKKTYEEYLVYEIRNRGNIDQQSLECIRRQEVDGVLSVQVIPKDAGAWCFWNYQGMQAMESKSREWEEKEFITKMYAFLETLHRIKMHEQLSLDSVILGADSIYMDEQGKIWLPVLPTGTENGQWEEKTKEMIRELIQKSRIAQTPFAQSLQVLLNGELVDPENLKRNLQLMVQKQQEEAEAAQKKKSATEELDWKARMEKSVRADAVKKPDAADTTENVNGVFFRRFRGNTEEPKEQIPEPQTEQRVVSGKLEPQPMMENAKKDTQVLRKNMLNTGNIGASSGGFASVAPVQLNQKKETDSSDPRNMRQENIQKQLHFVSFGTSAGVDILIDKSYFVLGKWAAFVDGVISYTSTISRSHCAIRKDGDAVYIEDLGSANGTFVNDKKLEPYEGVKITPKDTIRLAREKFAIAYR